MAISLSRNELLFAQVQAAYNTVPNTTGTATVGNSNAMRFIKATMDNQVGIIKRQDKTGTRTQTAGAPGRSMGKWSVEQSLSPNGVGGVKPDADPLFQGLMGQAGAVTTATSANGFPAGTDVADGAAAYKYTRSDAILPVALYSFRTPSTIDQRVSGGSLIQRAVFNIGQDGAATWTAEGDSKWVLSSNQFSYADTDRKLGLTTFPTAPASPVTNGGIIVGFTGKALLGGTSFATIRNATVTVEPGNQSVKDTFGTFTPQETEGDEYHVSTRVTIYEDDTTGFRDLVKASHDKTPIECVYQLGTIPGNMVVIHVKGVQLEPITREEERRFSGTFSDSPASGSSISSKDEITIWFV